MQFLTTQESVEDSDVIVVVHRLNDCPETHFVGCVMSTLVSTTCSD